MTAAVELPRVPWAVPDWHNDGAACRLFPELDRPEIIADGKVVQRAFNAWFEAKPGTPAALAAKVICAACPVRLDCATGALERGEPWGIWGGLDRADRKAIAQEFGFPLPGDPPPHGTNARRVKWNCDCRPCKDAHALYEAERRANARRALKSRGLWLSPLLVLVAPVRVGRVRLCPGQYLLPLDLPAPKHAEPEPSALAAAA
ncbi:WhiB family transcriptional regulator [Saccharothrix stipae]